MSKLYIGTITSKKDYTVHFSIVSKDIDGIVKAVREEFPNKNWVSEPIVQETYSIDRDSQSEYKLYMGKYNIFDIEYHFITISTSKTNCKNLINNLDGLFVSDFIVEAVYPLAKYKYIVREGKKFRKAINYTESIVEVYSEGTIDNNQKSEVARENVKLIVF
jgi:hypothetical protein